MCCCNKKLPIEIGDSKDYAVFLNVPNTVNSSKLQRKLDFWETKYLQNPTQYPYLNKLGELYENKFVLDGKIESLKKAEKFYQKVLIEIDSSQVNTLHSLCRNYISQHKFKECLPLLKKATQNGHKLGITHQILFDVHLELGNKNEAQKFLNRLKNPEDFNYLIRKSKWEDHEGNLNGAIRFLEVAKQIAEKQNNDYLKIWSYSNLGDYYGHLGNITKAYNYYLKTLQLDPSNNYVLKGIAWIQYAQNNNPAEANRILDTIIKRKKTPDLYLFKVELASYTNDSIRSFEYKKTFFKLANNPEYGVMYDSHKATLLAEINPEKAIELALQEVSNRPTAMAYHLLAWCYFKNGEPAKALQITKNYVDGFTFEPVALLHTALIYKALNKFPNKVASIKKELNEAAFELGPIISNKVKNL